MAFFVLIPICWITSILIYAASSRQQIDRQRQQALLKPSIAWGTFGVVNVISFTWFTVSGWSPLVAAVSVLLLNMLMVPMSIILLAHRPEWLKRSTLIMIGISIFIQLIVEGI